MNVPFMAKARYTWYGCTEEFVNSYEISRQEVCLVLHDVAGTRDSIVFCSSGRALVVPEVRTINFGQAIGENE